MSESHLFPKTFQFLPINFDTNTPEIRNATQKFWKVFSDDGFHILLTCFSRNELFALVETLNEVWG